MWTCTDFCAQFSAKLYLSLSRFLEQNQNQLEKNYFEVVINIFIERFIPYLTGEQVRFSGNVSTQNTRSISGVASGRGQRTKESPICAELHVLADIRRLEEVLQHCDQPDDGCVRTGEGKAEKCADDEGTRSASTRREFGAEEEEDGGNE